MVPVLFSLNRSIATKRSLPRSRNLAVVGELGSKYQTSGANARLTAPIKRKMPWYGLMPERTWPMPYDKSGPKMAAQLKHHVG